MSSQGPSFEAVVQNARLLRMRGENKKAILEFKKALSLNPNAIGVLNEMGLAHIHIGEQSEAIKAFDEAIKIQADDPTAYSNKAEAFLTIGSFEDALEASEKGLEKIPENADLHSQRARALESLMRIDDAIVSYNEALKYDSENPETWKALALCLDVQEKWTEVARAYRIAAALHKRRNELGDAESCEKFAQMAESSSGEMA